MNPRSGQSDAGVADLTRLTDAELDQLEKIVLKVGAGASGGPDGHQGKGRVLKIGTNR
jgi:hypothetical protein